MPLYIAKSGDLDRCYRCLTDSLTHSLTTLKDRATQILIKYKSGALMIQLYILGPLYYIGVVWQIITVHHESWVITLEKTSIEKKMFSFGHCPNEGGPQCDSHT